MAWWEFNDNANARLFYMGRTAQPSTSQLMPVPDNSDPLDISFGNPALKPYFSHNGGHYVTVISVESDGCFDVLDPSNRPGKFDDPYRSEMVKMKDGIAVCKPEALVKDVEMLEGRGFYLFKRK